MKLKALALVLLLPACAAAAEDCAKSADACSAGKKTISPFLAASAAEPETAKPAPVTKRSSLRQAAVSTSPAAVDISTAVPPAPVGGQRSSPAWVLLVLAGLGALYFYLSGGRRRGRRK